ncbi:MAG: hypothetical protein HY431_02975 [Candidatus Levybacteria bacterium]|nr:hypothetical protein [Candidatus Levybacteria bacterium]
MKLPYRKNVSIPREKLTKYLLSETHPVGSSKAKFFRSLGFDETNVDKLTESFSRISQASDVKEVRKLFYGINYVIDGTMETPSGKTVTITTVWFIKTGQNEPRFVTAYPV